MKKPNKLHERARQRRAEKRNERARVPRTRAEPACDHPEPPFSRLWYNLVYKERAEGA